MAANHIIDDPALFFWDPLRGSPPVSRDHLVASLGPPGASLGLSPRLAGLILTSCSTTWRSTALVFR
jgi:hypothetical protein